MVTVVPTPELDERTLKELLEEAKTSLSLMNEVVREQRRAAEDDPRQAAGLADLLAERADLEQQVAELAQRYLALQG